MLAPITQGDIAELLVSQCPTATIEELSRASKALYLIFRAGATAGPAAKPTTRKPRRHTEKSVAESLKLKR